MLLASKPGKSSPPSPLWPPRRRALALVGPFGLATLGAGEWRGRGTLLRWGQGPTTAGRPQVAPENRALPAKPACRQQFKPARRVCTRPPPRCCSRHAGWNCDAWRRRRCALPPCAAAPAEEPGEAPSACRRDNHSKQQSPAPLRPLLAGNGARARPASTPPPDLHGFAALHAGLPLGRSCRSTSTPARPAGLRLQLWACLSAAAAAAAPDVVCRTVAEARLRMERRALAAAAAAPHRPLTVLARERPPLRLGPGVANAPKKRASEHCVSIV